MLRGAASGLGPQQPSPLAVSPAALPAVLVWPGQCAESPQPDEMGAAPVLRPCTSLDWPGQWVLALGSHAVLAFLLLHWITRNFSWNNANLLPYSLVGQSLPGLIPQRRCTRALPGSSKNVSCLFLGLQAMRPWAGVLLHLPTSWGLASVSRPSPTACPHHCCLFLPALWECFWLSCDPRGPLSPGQAPQLKALNCTFAESHWPTKAASQGFGSWLWYWPDMGCWP